MAKLEIVLSTQDGWFKWENKTRRGMSFIRNSHNRPKQHEQATSKSPLNKDNPRNLQLGRKVNLEPSCLLPLSLQDLCLLQMISDLDSYPVEVLASLPHWLRKRLLNNLPALDLCHLECTPIARGVDITEVWNNIQPGLLVLSHGHDRSDARLAFIEKLFQINVHHNKSTWSHWSHRSHRRSHNNNRDAVLRLSDSEFTSLKREMESAFKELKPETGTKVMKKQENYLLEIASQVLSHTSHLSFTELRSTAHKLISIRGDVLLKDQEAKNWSKGVQTRWSIQGNPLAISTRIFRVTRTDTQRKQNDYEVQLTPRRLLPIHDRADPIELFSLLTNVCNLKPSSVNLNFNTLSQPIWDNLLSEQMASDTRLSFPSADSVSCISTMKCFLENVAILRLQSKEYVNSRLLIATIEAVLGKENKSHLKSLFCSLPDLYEETIQPFTAFFLLQNFHLLHLDLERINPHTLFKLLQGFMTAPCSHSQQLVICTTGILQLPPCTNEQQLASLDIGGATVPDCALQHKTLQMTAQDRILQFVLLFPSVRLTEVVLYCTNSRLTIDSNDSYIHLCACHPNFQVAKLIIKWGFHAKADNQILLATIKDDLISLLSMPTLQEVAFEGRLDGFKEAKLGLVLGLRQRSWFRYPLKKIVLGVNGYSEEDLKALWNALFSLPQLHQLEVALGRTFIDMVKNFSAVIYDSWTQFAAQQPDS